MNKSKHSKSIFVLLLLLAVTGMAKGQTHKDYPAKEWYYGFASHEVWSSRFFYQHLVMAGDTVIMGKECVIIKQADDYGNGFSATTFGYVNMGKQTFFLHREPDKLLWFNEEIGEFTVLHDYSAQVGDSWTIQVDSCSFDVVVDSTDLFFFGGKSHRVLYVHDYVSETSHFPYYSGCIIEDVGHTKHFFPIEIYWQCHNSYLCGTPEMLGIRCVLEDGKTLYHQGEVDCDSVYTISHIGIEDNAEIPNVILYPNPVSDILYIQIHNNLLYNNNFTYQIFDCQGICCTSGIIKQSDSISVAHLSKGFYILEISTPYITKNFFIRFVKY